MLKKAATKPGKLGAFILLGILSAASLSATPRRQTENRTTSGVLKILSVRQMTSEEYARKITDNIGANYIVRYRFEAPADTGVYLFSPAYGPPIGYGLIRSRGVIKWGGLPPGEDSSKNPGFKRLEKLFGTGWILLTPSAALEWESEARPTGDSEIAECLFVRSEPHAEPMEVFSPWFKIPIVDVYLNGKPK